MFFLPPSSALCLDAGFSSIILEADVKMEVKEVQDADLNRSTTVLLI